MQAMRSALNSYSLGQLLNPRPPKINKVDEHVVAQQLLTEYLTSQIVDHLTKTRNLNENFSNLIISDFVTYSVMLLYGDGVDALNYMQRQSNNPFMPVSPLLSITISIFIHTITTPDLMLLVYRAGGSVLELLAKMALSIERHPKHDEEKELKKQLEEEKQKESAHDQYPIHQTIPSKVQAPLWQSALKAIVSKTDSKPKAKPVKATAVKSATEKPTKITKTEKVTATKVSAKADQKTSKLAVKTEKGKSSIKAKLTTYMGNPDNPKQHPIAAGLARWMLGSSNPDTSSADKDYEAAPAPAA